MRVFNTIALSIFALVVLFSSAPTTAVSAQTAEERKDALKVAKKRAVRIARKEARRYRKDGYSNIVGDPPMEKQLEESFALNYIVNDNGQKKYFLTTQEAKAETFAAAKQQVYQLCIADIASQIGSEIVGKVKSNVANAESLDDAASVTEVIGAYQNRVAARLGRTEPIVVMKKKDGKYTALVMTMKYDIASAEEIIKNDLRTELRKKVEMQQDDIDKLLDF